MKFIKILKCQLKAHIANPNNAVTKTGLKIL